MKDLSHHMKILYQLLYFLEETKQEWNFKSAFEKDTNSVFLNLQKHKLDI